MTLDRSLLVILVKGDVEGAQVGVQSGILNGRQVGAFARLIAMLVPVAGRGEKVSLRPGNLPVANDRCAFSMNDVKSSEVELADVSS